MSLFIRFLQIAVLVVLVIFFSPGLPPNYDCQPHRPSGIRDLKGPLTPNSILDKAEHIAVNSENNCPESVAIRGDEVFTSASDGSVVSKVENGKFTRVGSFREFCESKNQCGPTAGIRFDSKGKLLAVNVGLGILKIDVDTGEFNTLIDIDSIIDGHHLKFPNDVDVDAAGNIYWSESSTIGGGPEDLVLEELAGPSGRLIRYDPKTKTNTVLVKSLHLANGVQLSENEEFVLVAESFGFRVTRYYLKGVKKGQHDVFTEDLPGIPDNIRPNGKGGFYIAMFLPRPLPEEWSLLEKYGSWPWTRRFIVRIQYLLLKLLTLIETILPGPMLNNWIFKVRGFGVLESMFTVSAKSLIVETDAEGNIIGSLQSDKGPISQVSEMSIDDKWAYLPTPFAPKLYRISLSELKN